MNGISSKVLEELMNIKYYISQKDSQKSLEFSQAFHTGEDPTLIWQNRQKLSSLFPSNAHFVSVMQVHSDNIYRVKEASSIGWEALDESIKADAIITDIPNVVLTILTADCVPILLADPIRRVVGIIHAGWKGSKLGISSKVVNELQNAYGVDPKNLYCFIAPSIGGCCYEVGKEVASHFEDIEGAVYEKDNKKYNLDLSIVNQYQFIKAGVPPKNIEVSGICTACNTKNLFSYRKEGGCLGRFMSAIMLKATQDAL